MTPQELKNSILQLAIQGKLVEQCPEEGTAEELYQQIQREKQALIHEGKIKKEKPLPEITEDEKPFDIPDIWKWVRLRDICTKIVDGDHNPPAGVSEETKYLMLSAQNINNDSVTNLDQVRYLTQEIFKQENERTNVHPGDIFFTIVGTLGRSCVYNGGYNLCFQRSVSVLTTLIYNYYLKYALDSGFIQSFMVKNSTGTAQKGFYLNQLEKLVIPLPPLAEQKRIVAKIEELLPLIDRYEKAWNRLEEFNKRFPDDLQKSLLQMAIQGKLVEQQAEEGTGEELYQQIQEEKQKLIKEGKIKKDKPTSEITEDDKPFDIPDSWKWIRLADAVYIRGGKRLPKGEKLLETPTSHIYIRVTDMQNGTILDNDLHYISESVFSQISQYIISRNDVYIVIVGSTIGKVGLVPDMFDGMNLTENAARMIPILIDRVFLYYLLTSKSIQRQFIDNTKQVGQPKLALFRLESTCIPLPPLAEQRRIVAKLEELLPLCEKLKQ